ncbi:hypothetical protein HDU96_007289 [Phlyctochytrium bullatum]|nr:hypothetical protein HDU96_007289 [Phlyctochytrium bullatum]
MSTRSGSPTPSTSSTSSSIANPTSTNLRFQQALLLQKQQAEQEDAATGFSSGGPGNKVFGPFVETVDAHYAFAKVIHSGSAKPPHLAPTSPLAMSLSRAMQVVAERHPALLQPGAGGLFPLSHPTGAAATPGSAPSSGASTPTTDMMMLPGNVATGRVAFAGPAGPGRQPAAALSPLEAARMRAAAAGRRG